MVSRKLRVMWTGDVERSILPIVKVREERCDMTSSLQEGF